MGERSGERFDVRRTVEWGDCDAAGIVFYPQYHRWMDAAFHALTRACGFDQRSLGARDGLLGTPLRRASCEFHAPATHGDVLSVRVEPVRLGRASLDVTYAFSRDGRAIANGRETRVFVRAVDGGRLAAAEMPASVRGALARFGASDDG